MSNPNLLNLDGKTIEGVYGSIDPATYRRHARCRSKPLTTCETCGQVSKRQQEDGVELKICQGCLSVAFCSKKCQIALWPSHKKKCGASELGSILSETVHRLLSHPFLLHYLRIAVTAKLVQSHGTQAFNPKECHHVVVLLNFHPISSEHEQGLVLGTIDPKGKDKIPGFLRLEVHDDPSKKIPIDVSGRGGLTKQRANDTLLIRLWREARKHANSIGHQSYPIVMVGFGYEILRQDYGIAIAPEVIGVTLATALGAPYSSPETVIPPSIKPPPLPWSCDDVIFFIILEYIILDTEDTLKLRRDLRRSDKEGLRRKLLPYLSMDGQFLGNGWSFTGSNLDLPEESRDIVDASGESEAPL